MRIAVLLFTYNRSYHTAQVINSLKKSIVLPQKLFVFQDGIKQESDIDEWNKVNSLIKQIDWCNKEIVVSESNRGLSASILSGVNYAFREYDAVIVLEDDCVPTANFISYMYQCFEKYQDNKKVYSVSGYSWPIQLEKDEYDVYGCGRISSWGWGTWKERWEVYEKDYELVKKMKCEAESSRNLAMWGRDLEDTVVGNVKGNCDSWAVFWALNVIIRKGICINPYESFIKNIGFDGSGVHCGITEQFDVKYIDEKETIFSLPDEIGFSGEAMRAFAPFLGSHTAINNYVGNRSKVLVYGVGNFYLRNEKQINKDYYIEKFIDKNKKGYFAGKEIIKPDRIKKCEFEKVVIMIQDAKECILIARDMVEKYDIPMTKIELGILNYDG